MRRSPRTSATGVCCSAHKAPQRSVVGSHSREEVGKTVVPHTLVVDGEMGVGWTGVRHDVELRRAGDLRLDTEHRPPLGASQRELEERSIRGEPVEARHARPAALESFD